MKALSLIAISSLLLLASAFVPAALHRPPFFNLKSTAAAAKRDAKNTNATTTSAAAPNDIHSELQQQQDDDKVADTTNQVMESTSPEDLVANVAADEEGEVASEKDDQKPSGAPKDDAVTPLPTVSLSRQLLASDRLRKRSPSRLAASLSLSVAPPLTIKKLLYGYALYSIIVDIFGRWMECQMKKCSDAGGSDVAIPTVDDLRATLSKVSGLVERPSDRAAWNRWMNSAPNDGVATLPQPGEYQFLYRDYVNYEERWAICKALKSIHWFFFRQTRRGTMRIKPGGEDVTMKEGFRLLTVIPTEVTWSGKIRDISSPYESKPRNCIVWNHTEMRIGFPFFRTVDSPPLAEKLRKQPWKIVKVSSGSDGKALLSFKRGSIGCLAYDEV